MIGYLINFEFTTSIKLQRSDPLKKNKAQSTLKFKLAIYLNT